MAITRVGGSWIHKYVSLVADDVTHTYTRAAKPELNLPNGSRCFEMDSDTEYIYDRENDAWEVYVPSSGGGGTTNYSQLSNKPSINNVELSGNKTLDALGINAGSIGFDESETYTDGSIGAEVSNQKNAISEKAPAIINSTFGDIVTFADGADNVPIKKIVGTIVPLQAAGTPTPVNPLTISGWTEADIIVSPTQIATDGTTRSINWQSEAGTIYGCAVTLNEDGSADVFADWYSRTFDGDTFYLSGGVGKSSGFTDIYECYNYFGSGGLVGIPGGLTNDPAFNLSDKAICRSARADVTNNDLLQFQVVASQYIRMYFNVSLLNGITESSTSTEILNAMRSYLRSNPVTIVLKCVSGVTYHFDNVGALRTYLGANNIWIDPGTITECDYCANTKLYVDNVPFGNPQTGLINQNVTDVAHRGYALCPENTLIAYKEARLHGYLGAEADVRFTSDGIPVLLHDATLNRTARNSDGTTLSSTVYIHQITYADALTYDFGIYKGSQYAGTKIPKFEDYLSLCKKIGLTPVIDLKETTRSEAGILVDLVNKHGLSDKAMWVSSTVNGLRYIADVKSDAILILAPSDSISNYITALNELKTNTSTVIFAAYKNLPSLATTINTAIANNIPLWIWAITSYTELDAKYDEYITGYLSEVTEYVPSYYLYLLGI